MNSRDSPEPVPYRDMWGKTIRPISQMKKLRPRGSPRSHSRSSWLDPACLIMPRLTLEDELLAHDPFRGSPSGRSLLPRKLLGGEGGEWGMESLTPGGLAPLNGRSTASPPTTRSSLDPPNAPPLHPGGTPPLSLYSPTPSQSQCQGHRPAGPGLISTESGVRGLGGA